MTVRTKAEYESDMKLQKRQKEPCPIKSKPRDSITVSGKDDAKYVVHISTIDRIRILLGIKPTNAYITRDGVRIGE